MRDIIAAYVGVRGSHHIVIEGPGEYRVYPTSSKHLKAAYKAGKICGPVFKTQPPKLGRGACNIVRTPEDAIERTINYLRSLQWGG